MITYNVHLLSLFLSFFFFSFFSFFFFLFSFFFLFFKMKRGPFAEHSPMLYDISAVPLWTKVNGGLQKMYAAEVMGKFPVVQHFLFGSLFTLKPAANPNPLLAAITQKA
jgi:hypothetical protein